jgi:hypothetical protein
MTAVTAALAAAATTAATTAATSTSEARHLISPSPFTLSPRLFCSAPSDSYALNSSKGKLALLDGNWSSRTRKRLLFVRATRCSASCPDSRRFTVLDNSEKPRPPIHPRYRLHGWMTRTRTDFLLGRVRGARHCDCAARAPPSLLSSSASDVPLHPSIRAGTHGIYCARGVWVER